MWRRRRTQSRRLKRYTGLMTGWSNDWLVISSLGDATRYKFHAQAIEPILARNEVGAAWRGLKTSKRKRHDIANNVILDPTFPVTILNQKARIRSHRISPVSIPLLTCLVVPIWYSSE